ncbi:GIY-YIG nuclease family protein [Occallatibacter savannae]|uniref:GIY-YIG nuclease family protein n=1 Tax=Occallatibacter savannae TaxID=1002691 RepID=UPI0013A560D7|nr:GIY-YIG nuclease family protein [Occallatibacter savannae]
MTGSRKNFYCYIVMSESGTLHTGHVGDLNLAVHRHRTKESPGKHDPKRLVYYEEFADERAAMSRAKAMKSLSRKQKLQLVSSSNPELADLIAGFEF